LMSKVEMVFNDCRFERVCGDVPTELASVVSYEICVGGVVQVCPDRDKVVGHDIFIVPPVEMPCS
jgi:hypothetical protein